MIGHALVIALNDLRLEARSRRSLASLIPFVTTVFLLFGFAFGPDVGALRSVAPSLLWLTTLFAAVLTLRSSFETETEDGAFEELLVAPIDPAAVFLGKVVALVVQLLALEAMATLGAVLLFGFGGSLSPLLAVAVAVAGTIGLAAIGVVFGTLAARARSREALLPVLLFPLVTPMLIAAVQTSGGAAIGPSWLAVTVAFAALSVSAGLAVFHLVVEAA